MPRLPRIYIKGELYYITCRGLHKQNIFRDEKDYSMFLELLKKYRQQYKIKLFSYVLLPDHLHLLLEMSGEGEQISSFMHDLNNAYTKYFNGRYERKGHLFRGRFKAALVEKEPNLIKLTAYIHLNPKRLNLVNTPEDYSYSSYRYYLEPGLIEQFDINQEITEVLSLLQEITYEEFTEGMTDEQANELHRRLQRGGIVGSEGFVKRVKQEVFKYHSSTHKQGSAGKYSRYKFFIIGGSFLLICIAGAVGLYFYYMALKPGQIKDAQRMMAKAIGRAEELDSSEWEVRLIPASGGKERIDTISFMGGKFISGRLNTAGYSSSNYSITIEEGGKIVWETMQAGPEGTASWHGEIEQGRMRGVLSLRQKGEKPQDFSFISIRYRRKR